MQDLAWVHDVLGIERVLDRAHQRQIEGGFESFETIDVHGSDPMLSADASAKCNTLLVHDQVDRRGGVLALFAAPV